MCFSPQADLVGGIVIGAIGVDVIRHVPLRRGYLGLAALPLLLAAHQLDETFVWWGLQGSVSSTVGRVATWIYLLFAFVVLPIYVPAAVLAIEPSRRRKWMIAPFLVAGIAVAAVLLVNMLDGGVTAELGHHHLMYGIGLPAGFLVTAAYVVATCGSVLFSGYRRVALFGALNLIAVAVLAHLAVDGFASLWCAWAALTSGALAVHLRFSDPEPDQPAYATTELQG